MARNWILYKSTITDKKEYEKECGLKDVDWLRAGIKVGVLKKAEKI